MEYLEFETLTVFGDLLNHVSHANIVRKPVRGFKRVTARGGEH